MSRLLSRPYPSIYGAPVLDRIDPRIFTLSYFGACMECTFCNDSCCQYGADVDTDRIRAMERHQSEIEAFTGVKRADWFREDEDDFGYLDEPEYPGGKYTRTAVVPLPAGRSAHNDEACVFLDPVGRGCRLHALALARGIDVHEIKPLVCLLFPASFRDGELVPALEFEDDEDLVCNGPGPTLYQSARADIRYYFGAEFVAELDVMEATERMATATNGSGSIPLPVCAS